MKETIVFIVPVIILSLFSIRAFAAAPDLQQTIHASMEHSTGTSVKSACISPLIQH